MDQFAYMHLHKKQFNFDLPENWTLMPTCNEDLSELKTLYETKYGGLSLKALDIEVSPVIKDLVDLEQEVVPKPPKGPGPVELAKIYLKNGVQPQRLLFNEIQMAIKQPSFTEALSLPAIQSTLKEFKVNIESVIEALATSDGDTGYEELNCIGMCQGAIDWLTATFRVKRPYGYKGNLCSPGSKEYIAFWVDWGDGAGWSYAGTGAATVHDLSKLPAGGVENRDEYQFQLNFQVQQT